MPPLILYSSAPLPVALTTIVPVDTAQVGCVTVGAAITGGSQITAQLPTAGAATVLTQALSALNSTSTAKAAPVVRKRTPVNVCELPTNDPTAISTTSNTLTLPGSILSVPVAAELKSLR